MNHLVVTREDFLASERMDPEVQAEYMAEVRRQNNASDAWKRAAERLNGLSGEPSPFYRKTREELTEIAERAVEARREFQRSPKDRILAACDALDALPKSQSTAIAVEEIRSACSRDFEASREYIGKRFQQILAEAKAVSEPVQTALFVLSCAA